jgi:hypothetical protein
MQSFTIPAIQLGDTGMVPATLVWRRRVIGSIIPIIELTRVFFAVDIPASYHRIET